jgi:DNA-binding response OmpR family regulator
MMSDTTSSPGKLAFIVEDEADSRELLKVILEDENWRVECAKSGSEALRVLTDRHRGEIKNFDPDVMLLDLRLADMSGLEVIEQLQKRGVKIPPTVIITAGTPLTLNEAMSRAGTIGLRKPFDFEELFSAIAVVIAMARTASAQDRLPGITP